MKYDVIVIGGGIAGVTAAIYLKRGGKNVLVLESQYIGGQIIDASEVVNYPGIESISGPALAMNFSNQLKSLEIEVKNEKVASVSGWDNSFVVNTTDNKYECSKVIIATGAEPNKLAVEGSYVGRGVSYCATCDGNFFKGKDVAVNGGGNTAIESALYLSNICNKVYLIHRRDEFRAEQVEVDKLKDKDNVEFVLNTNITQLNGENFLESIIVDQNGELKQININGLFVCIGRKPNSENLTIDRDSSGYIITTHDMETSTPGMYAIGDVRAKEIRQLSTASADGVIAAQNILKELEK